MIDNIENIKCPNCLKNNAQTCEHIIQDEINGDYKCDLPDVDTDGICETCQYTFCEECKEKYGIDK